MRVLSLASRKFDYHQDATYHGKFSRYPKSLGYVRGLPPLGPTPRRPRPDLVVVGSCKPQTVEAYLEVLTWLPPKTPAVWVDGGDRLSSSVVSSPL